MSRIRRTGLAALGLGMALGVACGGGDDGGTTGPAQVLVVSPTTVNLADCAVAQLVVELQDGSGNAVPGATYTFNSTATSISTVNGVGLVSAVAPGTDSIVVGSAGLIRYVPVTVVPAPLHLTNVPDSIFTWPGVPDTLGGFGGADCHGVPVAVTPPTVSSGSPGIATAAGSVVTGVAFGTATITLTSGSITAQFPAHVIGHPAGFTDVQTSLAGVPYGVAVTPSGRVLVTQIGGNTLATGQLPSFALTGGSIQVGATPPHVSVNPSGAFAYVTNQSDNSVSVVDLGSDLTVDTIPLAGNGFNLLASRDGARVYVTTDVGWTYVVDAQTHAKADSFLVGTASNGLAEDSARALVYISSRNGGTVTRYNTVSGTVVDTFVTGGSPQRMALSPDGNTLYIANESLGLDVWNTQTRTRIVAVPMAAYGLGLSPDGKQVYVAGANSNIRIVDAATRLTLQTLTTGTLTRNVAFEPNGRTAVVTDEGNSVHFIR